MVFDVLLLNLVLRLFVFLPIFHFRVLVFFPFLLFQEEYFPVCSVETIDCLRKKNIRPFCLYFFLFSLFARSLPSSMHFKLQHFVSLVLLFPFLSSSSFISICFPLLVLPSSATDTLSCIFPCFVCCLLSASCC